jgi:tripartite-type tricarboxylate transporter receptor subunit TctC
MARSFYFALAFRAMACLPGVPLATVCLEVHAQSEAWPSKPLRIIVPSNAGGGTADPVARVFAEELTKLLGQRVFVENRGGSNGNVGAALAARAPNDGYSVLFSWAGTLATNISLYKTLPFHPVRDFDPVALIGGVSNILVVNNDLPPRSLKELTEYLRSKPGKLNYASTGNGSSMHLAAELYKKETKTFMVHVPYNNVGQATTDLITNQVQLMFHLVTGAQGAIRSGQVRPIAVLAAQRSPILPEVPTMRELGVPIESQTWFALLFPKGTPSEAIQKLNEATNRVLNDPVARRKLLAMGLEPAGGTAQALSNHLNAEIKKWAEVVKYSGAGID